MQATRLSAIRYKTNLMIICEEGAGEEYLTILASIKIIGRERMTPGTVLVPVARSAAVV